MCSRTKNSNNRSGEDLEIVFLDVLRDELGFDLQHKCTVFELQWNDRREPDPVSAFR